MKCAGIKQLLSEYVDGVLDAQTKERLEEHLSTCVGCQQELKELETLIGELKAVESFNAPSDFLDRLHEKIEPRFSFGKIIKTLFVPMRIKIPVQLVTATATAVLVFSIINLQKPEQQFPQKLPRSVPTITEKEEVKSKFMKEPAEPMSEKKIYVPKPASQKATSYKKSKTGKFKDIASKGLKTEKALKLALILKTGTYGKPDLKTTPRKSSPTVESSTMHDEEKKDDTRSFLRTRIAGKEVQKKEMVAGAVKKDKMAETLFPEQKSALKEKAGAPQADVDKITKKLKKMIKDLKGEIKSIKFDNETGRPIFLSAVIPVDKYPALYERLNEMGVLHGPVPVANEKKKEMIKVELVISKYRSR